MEQGIFYQSITMEEQEGSIFRLKTETAPGPEVFSPELFYNEGKEFLNKSNVNFIKKPFKLTYNNTSSQGPISLTSVISKFMERIILFRLEEYMERYNITDNKEKGFRKYGSTVNALMSFVQSIYGSF